MMDAVRSIADAVLYEGMFLFPYGKNALKNQMPFQFGVLMPDGYADKSEPSSMRTEFVVLEDGADARIEGLLRFLHVGEKIAEREVSFRFNLNAHDGCTPFHAGNIKGSIKFEAQRDGDVAIVAIEVSNESSCVDGSSRNDALRDALVSAHLVLQSDDGVFTSLVDPPQRAVQLAARCRNGRFVPVLAGDPADESRQTSRTLLVSPIILYDFPHIAKASSGRTFDGTEIDELLMLSVASMTDAEKTDARASHPYVRELIERAEALDADTQAMLHGELTGAGEPGDETVVIGDVTVRRGSRVRVEPKGRADVWDDVVRGMTARVQAVHTDFEGKRHIGVIFDADPAGDMHEWYGRSFFYGVDELEPLA